MGYYIRDEDVARLKAYRYSGVDKSFLSRYVLSKYWNWLVTKFPLWWAPNLITLSGFGFIILDCIIIAFLNTSLALPGAPNWVYLFCAISMFIYQSFDAIDGKQARRTGTSSPLGELFDHGCDALNTTLGSICAVSALGLGPSWWGLAILYITLSNFYISTAETYLTGTLYLSYFSGPVEGIMLTIILFLISGIKGASWWAQDAAQFLGPTIGNWIDKVFGPIPLNHLFVYFGGAFIGYNVFMSFININAMTNDPNAKAAHHPAGMTRNPFVVFFPYLVYIPLNTLWIHWANSLPGQEILGQNIMVVFLYAMGIGFGYQVGLMVLAHVCQREFPVWNGIWTYVTLASFYTFLRAHGYMDHGPSQSTLVWTYLVVSCGMYAHFANGVIKEMCDIFDIWCLRIKKLPKEEIKRIKEFGWKGWDIMGFRKLPEEEKTK